MRFKSIETEAEHFFPENILIAERILKKTQQHIGTTTGCITESLQRQPFFKRLIKKINYSGNLVMNHDFFLAGAKIIVLNHRDTKAKASTEI
jgi:hypothetical protein